MSNMSAMQPCRIARTCLGYLQLTKKQSCIYRTGMEISVKGDILYSSRRRDTCVRKKKKSLLKDISSVFTILLLFLCNHNHTKLLHKHIQLRFKGD